MLNFLPGCSKSLEDYKVFTLIKKLIVKQKLYNFLEAYEANCFIIHNVHVHNEL